MKLAWICLNLAHRPGLWGAIGGHMKIDGFHRGLLHWICQFQLNGRDCVAYLDRPTGKWMFAHMERIDPATKGEMDMEMTEKLREHLKTIGIVTDKNTTANNGHNQGEEE